MIVFQSRFVKLFVLMVISSVGALSAFAGDPSVRCNNLLTKREGNMVTKEEVIKKLGLAPLPEEGGFYRETYRCSVCAPAQSMGISAEGQRNLSTAIYYLIGEHDFSALHRVKGDEVFHFYGGDPVEMLQITPDGQSKKIVMGSDILNGQEVQVVVPAGTWQGTRLQNGGQWALLGTTMSPGFEFTDFELGPRDVLSSKFPALAEEITRYTR